MYVFQSPRDIIELTECTGRVPVCPALRTPTNSVDNVRQFASTTGYPIMVKAVDGGGGRGIRLIRNEEQLESSVKRAVEESPSKQLFAEKAAVDGFRHVEVQIIGDGTGNVTHLWERECSIQRRFQKIIELAPSVVTDRALIAKVIEDALKMARHVSSFKAVAYVLLRADRSNTFHLEHSNSLSTLTRKNTISLRSIHAYKSSILSPSLYR